MAVVTVIITVLNDHRVTRALDSVLSQAMPADTGLQVIVVDDSTDGTGDLLSGYGDRIEVSSTPGGAQGIYAARNQGIAMARGDFIAFLGADDVYADVNVISDLMRVYDENLDRGVPGFAHGWLTMVNLDGTSWDPPRMPTMDLYRAGWILPDLATLWSRPVFDEYGFYSSVSRYFGVSGDHELFRRVVLHHKTPHVCLDRTVTLMAVGGLSTRDTLRDRIRTAYELWRCMRAHPQLPAPFYGHNRFAFMVFYLPIRYRIIGFIKRMKKKWGG